jgi:phage protein D
MLPGVINVEINANNHLAASRFCLSVALDSCGYEFWVGDTFLVEIRVGLAGGWASLIYGAVDRLDVDIGRGLVRLDGRDLTSRFIAARTRESFENQTASDIATALAARHGLQAAVTATTNLVGRNYQSGHSRLTLDQHARSTTEWDLLIRLAEGEGFDVWVDGQVLNFAPPNQAGNNLLLGPSDCMAMRLRRLLTLSGGLEVSVKSWDCRGQKAVVQTVTSATGSGNMGSYVVVRPNLTNQAAQTMAQRLLTQMSQHERSISIEMPGDVTTKPRDLLTLMNTGTDFDGLWTITEVDRRIDFQQGFVQVLEARMPVWTAF